MTTIKKKVVVDTVHVVRKRINDILASLVDANSAKGQKARGVVFSEIAREWFDRQYVAYDLKSTGLPDEFGNTWKPLSLNTRIYRHLSADERKRFGVKRTVRRGLLSADEDRQWRKLFSMRYSRLAQFMDDATAKAKAARHAWAVMKERGARTKKSEFVGRDVRILVDTHRLHESFRATGGKPGTYYRPRKDQLAKLTGTRIELGTTVPYAMYPDRERPLIPSDTSRWVSDGLDRGVKILVDRLVGDLT